ncbi:hypothetical protein [Haloarchaeobius amylolyticus]|uniref:hypothetical protein n=1 Tax=Haloarchaeobius amylolyticus TaxID=1198296 RepID=UPI0022718B67|nr:hypothetical protein [Haloarchaeobius amylolyticus]
MKLLQRLTGLFGSEDGGQSPDAATEQAATPSSPSDTAAAADTGAEAAPEPADETEPTQADDDAGHEADADEADPEPRDRTEVFREQAAACVAAWPEADLDYSPASLERLDEVAAELADEGANDKQHVLSLGSYFGETLLRQTEGEWRKPESGAWAVVLTGEETDVTLNVFQIADGALSGTSGFAATYRSVERRF